MIFVTVGSRSFQFNRLLEAIDIAVKNGEIKDEIFAQIGSSDYKPKNFNFKTYLNHDDFNEFIEKCDIVITHGGTGIIMNAIKKGKKVVAVPRLTKYKEVIDDHQLQLVREFEKMGIIIACYDCCKIGEAVQEVRKKSMVKYISNTKSIINSIEKFLSEI